jgi:hypothetical protein
MAKPAASSLAPLMRLPVDNCSMATEFSRPDIFKADCVYSALTFVLMTVMSDSYWQRFTDGKLLTG